MDKVKFGRALGYGARHAAKALTQAVDAATTPSPAGAGTTSRAASQRPSQGAPRQDIRQDLTDAARTMLQAHQTVQQGKSQVRQAAKVAGKSALAPVAKFSSVLWMQVTGVFFGMMALALCSAAWKMRGAWALPVANADRLKLCGVAALGALFLYFTVSNFVRAARRQRR